MKMKFSDAVLLGSTLLKPMRGTLFKLVPFSTDKVAEHGCAIGMALKALGRRTEPAGMGTMSLSAFLSTQLPEYPWLTDDFADGDRQCPYHCGTMVEGPLSMIVHIFDSHVCREFGESLIPFSSLIEYIKTIEPEEVDASAEETEEVEHEIQRSDAVGVA